MTLGSIINELDVNGQEAVLKVAKRHNQNWREETLSALLKNKAIWIEEYAEKTNTEWPEGVCDDLTNFVNLVLDQWPCAPNLQGVVKKDCKRHSEAAQHLENIRNQYTYFGDKALFMVDTKAVTGNDINNQAR